MVFEAMHQRDLIWIWEADPQIVDFASEPLRIDLITTAGPMSYFADALSLKANGELEIVETKKTRDEVVALGGDVAVYTAAPSSYEGNAPAEGIAMDLLHQTRLDADRPPAGVRKNARKADATPARNQKKRQEAAVRAAKAEVPNEREEVKQAMFVPGGTKTVIAPMAMPGWGPR